MTRSRRLVPGQTREEARAKLKPGSFQGTAPRGRVASGSSRPSTSPTTNADFAAGATVVISDVEPAPPETDPASVTGGGNTALLSLSVPAAPTPTLVAVAAGIDVAVAQWLLIVAVGQHRRRRR